MKSTERIRRDHEVIVRVLAGVEALATRLSRGEAQWRLVGEAIRAFSVFMERCHDAKEEVGLFPVLAEHGLPMDSGPLAVVQGQHEDGRRLLQALTAAVTAVGRGAASTAVLASLAQAYVALLREHIAKENEMLLPYAERVLTPGDESRVSAVFDSVDERESGPEVYDVLVGLADALEQAGAASAGGSTAGQPVAAVVASQIMRPNVPAVRPDESLARAAELMESLGVRELPVVDGGLVGVIAERDLQPHRGHYEWTAVRAAMTVDPVTVAPDAPIGAIACLLLERSFNSVPVVSEGRLLGMVGRSDLLRLLAEGDVGRLAPS